MNSFNNNDPIKQFVKGKLANYKQEVPPSSWEELESSLFAAQKTKVLHKRWIVSSVAAVAAIFIGAFFMIQTTNNELPMQSPKQQQVAQQQTEENSKLEGPIIQKQKINQVEKSTETLIADNADNKSLLQHAASITANTITEEDASSDISNYNTIAAKESIANTDKETATDKSKSSNNIEEAKKQQMIQDFIDQGKRSSTILDDTKTIKKKNKYGISLSGRSSFSGSQQSNMAPTTLRSSLNKSYGNYTLAKMEAYSEGEAIKPESETSHNQPISFGVLTSFDITPKLQIETGLIYTYLSSETKNKSGDFNNGDKVQFHYLGVPINLNYYLLSINKLNLYVTVGAMIEKDVYGKIKYNEENIISSVINSEYANRTTAKINQKNPQLSLTGGAGISYPVYNKINLFGKIGGRYHINANNEYKTYYSDQKFGLDIQLGLKFNF